MIIISEIGAVSFIKTHHQRNGIGGTRGHENRT